MIHALDFSSGARNITPAWAEKQKVDGYSLMISQLWGGWSGNSYAEGALTTCKEAGHRIAGYTYLTDFNSGEYAIQQAARYAGDTLAQLEWLALDCEYVDENRKGLAIYIIEGAILETERLGLKPILYTGAWYWKKYMTTNSFSHLPLWTADYDYVPELDSELYGGWQSQYGKQYIGTTDVDGIGCDLNVFADEDYPAWLHEFWKQATSLGGGKLAENIERSIRIMKGEETL